MMVEHEKTKLEQLVNAISRSIGQLIEKKELLEARRNFIRSSARYRPRQAEETKRMLEEVSNELVSIELDIVLKNEEIRGILTKIHGI